MVPVRGYIRGATKAARLRSHWSKKPSGQKSSRPSLPMAGVEIVVPSRQQSDDHRQGVTQPEREAGLRPTGNPYILTSAPGLVTPSHASPVPIAAIRVPDRETATSSAAPVGQRRDRTGKAGTAKRRTRRETPCCRSSPHPRYRVRPLRYGWNRKTETRPPIRSCPVSNLHGARRRKSPDRRGCRANATTQVCHPCPIRFAATAATTG